MFILLILGLSFVMVPFIGWAWARKLTLKKTPRPGVFYGRAVGLGLLTPVLGLIQYILSLLQHYQPDQCGSWWLGATPEQCTLFFYLISRTLAALIFLILPFMLLSVSLVLAIFWNVQANRPNPPVRGPNKG